MDVKHKLEQIKSSLEHQSDNVKDLVMNICEGIETKIKKDDYSYNFCISKDNKVFNEIKRVVGIFQNFDIKINIFKDTQDQVIYCVYFKE
jgi:hypothetical protein